MKSNVYKKLRTVLFTAGLVCVSVYAMTNAAGPPAENTGAPGDNTCGQSTCHNFTPITSGFDWGNISLTSTIPAAGYVPGNSYSLTLSHVQPGHSIFGFQIVLLDANGINAGTLSGGSGSTAQSSNGKVYVNHTSGGTSGIGGRSWTFGWSAPSTPQGTLTAYVAVCVANNDGLSSGDSIYTKGFILYLTGTAPPTASITADKTTICQNDTVHFTGSGQNSPSGYIWSFPGGTTVGGTTSTSPNPIVVFNGTFAGTNITRSVSLITTNGNGNSQPATQAILVNAAPTATTTPTGNVSICGNDSLTMTAASGTGYQYLWSPGSTTGATLVAKASGTFSVKVTNSSTGCTKVSPNIVVTKRSIPTITMTVSRDSICQGDTVKFTAPSGFLTYEYFKDTTKVQTGALLSYIGKPATANVYTVYGTDANGCRSTPSNTKSVYAQVPLVAPTVSCGATTVSSITFNWTAVNNSDGYEVSADSGKNWTAPSSGSTGLTHSITGLNGGTKINLYVRATQSSGRCAKGDIGSAMCQATACVPVTFTLTSDSIVCNPLASDSANAVLSNISAAKFSVKVDQVTSAGVFVSNVYPYSSTTSYKLKINGTNTVYYKVSVVDSAQILCPASTKNISIRGVVSPSADPVLTFGKTVNVLCDREVASFTFTKPTGTDRFNVFKNSTSLGTITGTSNTYPSSTFANGDVVKVYAVNDASGCSRASNPIQLVRKADPAAGFLITKDTTRIIQFNDTTNGSISWNWKFGDGGSSTIKTPSHTYTLNGTYKITLSVTTSDQCKSDTAEFDLKLNVGLLSLDGLGQFKYYPNPVKSTLMIDFSSISSASLSIQMTDMEGRVVREISASQRSGNIVEIDMNDLKKGMYMIIVKTDSAQKAFPVIKD